MSYEPQAERDGNVALDERAQHSPPRAPTMAAQRSKLIAGVVGGMLAMSGAMWGFAQVGSPAKPGGGGGGTPAQAPGPKNPVPSPNQPGDKTPIERPPAPTSPPSDGGTEPVNPNAPGQPQQPGQPGQTNPNDPNNRNAVPANETALEREARLRRASGPFAFANPQAQTAFNDNVQNLMRMERRMDESRRVLLKRLGDVRQLPPERQSAATLDLLQQILQENESMQSYLVRSRTSWTGEVEYAGEPATNPGQQEAGANNGTPAAPIPDRPTGWGR